MNRILSLIIIIVLTFNLYIPKADALITYVSFIESNYNSVTPVDGFTLSINIGTRTNGLLVCGVMIRDAQVNTVESATYNGVSMGIAVTAKNDLTADLDTTIIYLTNPTNGTNDLVVAFTGSTDVNQYNVQCAWVDGAHQTQASVLDQTNSATGNSSTPSVSVTPTEDNEIVFSFILHEHPSSPTGYGQTEITNRDAGAFTYASSYVIQTTASAVGMSYTYAGADNYSQVVASFKQASAGGGGGGIIYQNIIWFDEE